jgi:cysteine desulfurase family protein (TIGR01976 family)
MTTTDAVRVDAVRAHFPALERHVDGHPVAYFDGPGGTQVPTPVADAVRAYLLEHNANSGWNYPTSHETDHIVAEGRAAFADLFGARPDEVAFGQNMTTLTLRVSRAIGRTLRPGDPVVVTELDHHANVDPWKALEAERGAEIRVVGMDPATGTLDMADLEAKLEGARILAIGAASNAIGTITDVAAASAMARAEGAVVFVDAVHYAPHALVDVGAMGADFLVVSPYKLYGPHLGVLWGKRERLESLVMPRVASAPDNVPDRVETGTLSFEAIAGAAAAVDFLAALAPAPTPTPGGPGAAVGSGRANRRGDLARGYDWLHARGEALFRQLWDGMNEIPGARTHGPSPGSPRTPTLGFAVDGADPKRATAALARQGVFVTHGDFYATTVVRRLGYGDHGMLRAGCLAYTTGDEVDRLLEAVRALVRTRG